MSQFSRIPLRAAVLASVFATALAAVTATTDAKTLRWAGRGDMQTTDHIHRTKA